MPKFISIFLLQAACLLQTCFCQSDLEIDFFQVYTSAARQSESLTMTILNEAPRINGSNSNEPSFEFSGEEGLSELKSDMLDSITCGICSHHEVTIHASLFFVVNNTGGPVMQLVWKKSPIFTFLVNPNGNSLSISYLHQSKIISQNFTVNFKLGTWYKVAIHFSGNLLKLFVDCELKESRLIPIPDYCVSRTGMSMHVGQDISGKYYTGSLQSVRMIISENPLGKQCESFAGLEVICPICGSHLSTMKQLKVEKDRILQLEAKLANLTAEGAQKCDSTDKTGANTQKKDCIVGSRIVLNGTFVKTWDDRICYCQDGNSICSENVSTLTIAPSLTVGEVTVAAKPSPSSAPATMQDMEMCGRKTVGSQNIQLTVGQVDYSYVNGDCEINTCRQSLFGGGTYKEETVDCDNVIVNDCTAITDDRTRNLSLCCSRCTACQLFAQCPSTSDCVPVGNGFTCVCKAGYESGVEKNTCIDVDECTTEMHDCPVNSTCVNIDGSFTCSCPEYFTIGIINGMKKCIDIDECATGEDNCPIGTVCKNKVFGFDCTCLKGFRLDNDRCIPICDPSCKFGECIAPNTCQCIEGYNGTACDLDIDECKNEKNPCSDDSQALSCVNTFGGYFCSCRTGTQRVLKEGAFFCKNVNECQNGLHLCPRGTECRNGDISYVCEQCTLTNGDCKGSCSLQNGILIPNGTVHVFEDKCDLCTCKDGDYTCQRIPCNCSDLSSSSKPCCQTQCSRDEYCYREDGLTLKVNEHKVDSNDSCSVVSCVLAEGEKVATLQYKSTTCDSVLNCPEHKSYTPIGSCCPVCSLPTCDQNMNGYILDISNNGGEICSCDGSKWTCNSKQCDAILDCPKEHIAKLNPGECPQCVVPKSTQTVCSS